MTRAYNYVEPDQCHNCDYDCSLQEVLFLHYLNLKLVDLFLFFFVDSGNRGAGYFNDRFVCTSDEKARVAHRYNHTNNASISDHTITNLKSRYRFLKLSLSFLLRPNQQDIKDANDQH